MSATSLKLPEDLKRRIGRMAAHVGQTPHAFMVEALAREATRSELRERFAVDAEVAERAALASGKSVPLAAAFNFLEQRVAGKRARRPKARAWRASK
jgi:predicted transcriptional regulator